VKCDKSDLPPLPEPSSDELSALVTDPATREIYAFLHRRRNNPPTMVEIRAYMADRQGSDKSQTDRRLRSLRERGLDVPADIIRGEHRYVLKGWRPGGPRKTGPNISAKVKAQVLAPKRCAQCGKTPLEDGVKLVVDHKVPQEWGGGDEIENLQPLCEECNGGKKSWFATYDAHAGQIREAINYLSVHVRIGELLKAFEGEWVFTELIGIVASAQSFQEDYQKRTRDLRYLGWTIKHQNRYNEGARVRSYYKCTHWEPWPDDPTAEVRRIERERTAANKAKRAAQMAEQQ
jgi:5-methylcytosine-specific restriction endonuclease McrA